MPFTKLSCTDIEFAVGEGLDQADIQREHAKFREYYLIPKVQDGNVRDWAAAWRLWVLRAVEYRISKNRARRPPPSHKSRGDHEARPLDRYRKGTL